MLNTYFITTCMGQLYGSSLPCLTSTQEFEFNHIGYTGNKLNGEKSNYSDFLNSLGIGEFHLTCTKADSGDFIQEFTISHSPIEKEDITDEKEDDTEKTILLKMDYPKYLPTKTGTYSVRISLGNKQFGDRKIFWNGESFNMKNGRKDSKIVCWYKRVEIPLTLFNDLLDYEKI